MRKTILIVAMVLSSVSCATQHKLGHLKSGAVSARLELPEEVNSLPEFRDSIPDRDTLKITDDEGKEVLIMKAVKDENGEMVATDVIRPAMVTARFRNLAERHGKVDLKFEITVPKEMQDSKWQLRFSPLLSIMGDSTYLEPVVITGADYRKAQLRGYQQYEKFLAGIISDADRFIDRFQLEIFLKRNIPQLYRFKNDSTLVSDEEFASAYGVTEEQAVRHYTYNYLVNRNRRKIEMKDKMYHKYLKSPIITEGLRLDTVMTNADNDFIYCYVQTINTRPKLKKAKICIEGSIFEQDKMIYGIPRSAPLTFYISSLSSFVDDKERYLTKVISRRAESNTACYIDFGHNSSEIDVTLGENRSEIRRIKDNLVSLMENSVYDIDSIIVTASCSPEGKLEHNRKLSLQRAATASVYFDKFMKEYADSASKADGYVYDVENNDYHKNDKYDSGNVKFISKGEAENWTMLASLVELDKGLGTVDKSGFSASMLISDPDKREENLHSLPGYIYMREKLYPRLRTVRFEFFLHRKGMIRDTVMTTVLDSNYMAGVRALKNMEYKEAIDILRPYHDYNTAVAYCAMDYNSSAMEILSELPASPQVLYLKAVIFSRLGNDQAAVDNYLKACRQQSSYISRGNLDPEISALIKKYDLHKTI